MKAVSWKPDEGAPRRRSAHGSLKSMSDRRSKPPGAGLIDSPGAKGTAGKPGDSGTPGSLERMVEILDRADRVNQADRPDRVGRAGRAGRVHRGDSAGARAGVDRHGAAMAVPGEVRHLDSEQLAAVTQAVRDWAGKSARRDVRASRLRVLLAFLLLRWTGAKLGEVLGLDDRRDLEARAGIVRFHRGVAADAGRSAVPDARSDARSDVRSNGPQAQVRANSGREVRLPEPAALEIARILADPGLDRLRGEVLRLDPAHIRRKLYERAEEAGLPREALNPTVLRRSRAIELLRADVPLTIVQATLGQSSPDLTASLVEFGEEDTRRIMARTLEREARRTSSARNAFFGKVASVRRGDIQAEVEMATLGGLRVVSVVTTRSVDDLGLRPGTPVAAEIKAPLVSLVKGDEPWLASIENRLPGRVEEVRPGEITAEVVTALADSTRMAAIITTESARRLGLAPGDAVQVLFSAFAVVLKVD